MKLKVARVKQKPQIPDKKSNRVDSITDLTKNVDGLNGRVDMLSQNFNTLNNKVESISDTLDLVAQTVANHSEQLEKHFTRLEILDQKLENLVTKTEHQEVMNMLDKLIKLHIKKDDEMTMMSYRIQENTKDIEKIKPLVGLAV